MDNIDAFLLLPHIYEVDHIEYTEKNKTFACNSKNTHANSDVALFLESHRFCNRVQDAYTLRCCPQVHGIVHDTIEFVQKIITTEMNSGTDNPVMCSIFYAAFQKQ